MDSLETEIGSVTAEKYDGPKPLFNGLDMIPEKGVQRSFAPAGGTQETNPNPEPEVVAGGRVAGDYYLVDRGAFSVRTTMMTSSLPQPCVARAGWWSAVTPTSGPSRGTARSSS